MAHPAVARRLNTRISGDPSKDAYAHLKDVLLERGWTLPVPHAVSLGCGFGALERAIAPLNLAERIDVYDLADVAIAEARTLAAEQGLTNVHCQLTGLGRAGLREGSVDLVRGHQSVHHIEELDGLCLAVRRALRPGGIVHLHACVGPGGVQWTDTQLGAINDFVARPAGALPRPRHRRAAARVAAPGARGDDRPRALRDDPPLGYPRHGRAALPHRRAQGARRLAAASRPLRHRAEGATPRTAGGSRRSSTSRTGLWQKGRSGPTSLSSLPFVIEA